MIPFPRTLAIGLLTTALPALAGGQATLEASGEGAGTMQLSWADEDTVRLDPGNQPAYMLVRDGKAYSVSNAGGQTMVMDLSSMSGAMQTQGGPSPSQQGTVANARSVDSMKATGTSETVAGIEGEVYEIAWTDGNGQKHTDEAVLTEDETVVEMTAAFRGFADTMGSVGGDGNPDAIGEKLKAENKGLLRFSNQMRVTAVSDGAPSADEFELPAEPMDMQKMLEGMQRR